MASRLELHEELVNVLGTRNVYYQPPESLKIIYPAIIYSRHSIDNYFANNDIYNQNIAYQVTVVDKNPDSDVVFRLSKKSWARFVRHFTSNELNHDVFTVKYKK